MGVRLAAVWLMACRVPVHPCGPLCELQASLPLQCLAEICKPALCRPLSMVRALQTEAEGAIATIGPAYHVTEVVGLSACIRKPLVITVSTDRTLRLWNYRDWWVLHPSVMSCRLLLPMKQCSLLCCTTVRACRLALGRRSADSSGGSDMGPRHAAWPAAFLLNGPSSVALMP